MVISGEKWYNSAAMRKVLVTLAFLIIYLIMFDLFVEGPVGISPDGGKGCLGASVDSSNPIIRKTPAVAFGWRYPFNFRFEIKKNAPEITHCLGKNIVRIK